MKTLLILRHAKSSKDNPNLKDFDRPLNDRGRRDAPRVGVMLKDKNLIPDDILSSPALRAKDTAKLAAENCGFDKEIHWTEQFYPGEPEDYLNVLKNQPDSADSIMIVGHNPGIEELVWTLTGKLEEIPTASLTHVELPIDHWNSLSPQKAKLVSIWRPREHP